MEILNTNNAPAAIGPYSQGIISGKTLYLSGQIPLDAKTGAIVGSSITDQAHQVLKNLSAVLWEAGSGMDKVVKTTCFLADMQDFAPFNEVYAQYFTGKPARSCVAVRTLPKNVLVEVECVAVVE